MKRIKKRYTMKRNINFTGLLLMFALMIMGCEEYLDIPPEADITEEEIFGDYINFQGFQDQLLRNVVDYNRHGARVTHAIGGEALSPSGQTVLNGNNGNYWYVVGNRGIYAIAESNRFKAGLYTHMWENIRMANKCIEKVDEGFLTDATDEQRDWIKGQAYFYRAFFYYEFVRSFGTVPYIEEVISSEDQNMERHWSYEKNGKTYNDTQACFEKIVEDFDRAAALLPDVWPIPGVNWGRPTSIASKGFKAKALQFSASPLFNEQSTGSLSYDNDLLDRCAAACIETINLAKSAIGNKPADMVATVNSDGLTNWEYIRDVFSTAIDFQVGTQEVLFNRPIDNRGPNTISQSAARSYSHRQITNQKAAQASQNYIDKFEMSDGSRYSLAYDQDPTKRWENRDKRLRLNHYFNGDEIELIGTLNFSASQTVADGALNSNAIRKFLADGISKKKRNGAGYSTPLLRLADIYLTYAEAVYESTGSYTASAAGSNMTAEDAVNIVRSRAGQPDVAATLPFYENNILPGSTETLADDAFRLLYRNERHVELAYEGVHWFDTRRWKRAHLKDGVELQAMTFDVGSKSAGYPVDDATVTRVSKQVYTFKDQHYWMPFQTNMTRFTTDWEQNPGW